MQGIAKFIVRFHAAIFCAFIALACIGAIAMVHVHINRDMAKYLPDDFQMSQGSDIMNEEFGEAGVFNVMVEGVPIKERADLAKTFENIDGISAVTYEEDDPHYNSGDFALYTVNADVNSYSDDAGGVVYVLRGFCSSRDYNCWIDNEGLDSAANGLGPVLVVAVCIAMVILFVLANSWIEPLLLLFTILVAVAINMGSNIFFGEISETTNAIGAVLQMALSMDYLIMLLNRYRREHTEETSPLEAMERAITGGMSTIASSSVTTIVGLLCLVLMSFTIGRDLGLVLAKGVFLSLVCAFGVMPSLVLWFEDLMDRTAKPTIHPKMTTLANISYKLRVPLAILCAAVFVFGFALRGFATASFLTESKNPDRAQITSVFDLDSQLVILLDKEKNSLVTQLLDTISSLDGVRTLSAYETTIGKQRNAKDMAEENDMDTGLVNLFYYDKFKHGQTGSMTKNELVDYLRSGMQQDLGRDYIDTSMQDKLDTFADLVDDELEARAYTCEQAADALSSHASIHEETLRLIYLAYFANREADATWTMSTEELMSFLVDDVLEDPVFDDVIDRDARDDLLDARDKVLDARDNFIGEQHERVILYVSYAPDSPEMDTLVSNLRQLLDENGLQNSYYLVGQGPMVQEMTNSFDGEFNFLSIVTIVAILLIVLVTFRSIVIPVVLVAIIQSAFCWDMVLSAIVGQDIYYIALFCVQSILMGATIDYAILLTSNYREARERFDIRESIGEAYRNSIRTVSMSGSILVFVCLCLGLAVEGITGQICLVISEGATIAVFLVMLVLPGTLATLDKLVVKRKRV